MKIKTNELEGVALDWAVARAQNMDYFHPDTGPAEPAYSTNWAQGGPIIEQAQLTLEWWNESNPWMACIGGDFEQFGPTPLIAAMRCFVASRLGDEVEIPDALIH